MIFPKEPDFERLLRLWSQELGKTELPRFDCLHVSSALSRKIDQATEAGNTLGHGIEIVTNPDLPENVVAMTHRGTLISIINLGEEPK